MEAASNATDPAPKWKLCFKCKRVCPIAEFARKGDRHHSYCKPCVRDRVRQLRAGESRKNARRVGNP